MVRAAAQPLGTSAGATRQRLAPTHLRATARTEEDCVMAAYSSTGVSAKGFAAEAGDAKGYEIDITLYWGSTAGGNAIAEQHLPVGSSVLVGEDAACHFTVPGETLGAQSHQLVTCDGGEVTIHPPAGAAVFVDRLMHQGSFVLRAGHTADVTVGGFTFRIGVAEKEKAVPRAFAKLEDSALPTIAGAGVFHAALFAAFAFFMPAMGNADDAGINRDHMLAMKHYMSSIAEKEQDEIDHASAQDARGAESQASGGARAKDAEGAMGGPKPVTKPGRWSEKGDSKPEDMTLARQHALEEAEKFGMIGLLSTAEAADPNAPVVPWGSVASGADQESHMGNLWAGDIGDAFGSGLGLTGTGEGGGGKGEGLGVNDVGGLGRSLDNRLGACTGGDCGHGHGHGHVPGTHVAKGPSVHWRNPTIDTNGRLDPQVIQRVVRLNSGRFIGCYQDGLRSNPSLQGRVAVQFLIGRDGSVATAADTSGSDLADPGVRSCVVRSFYSLSFPSPKGGTVRVIYPFSFTPAD